LSLKPSFPVRLHRLRPRIEAGRQGQPRNYLGGVQIPAKFKERLAFVESALRNKIKSPPPDDSPRVGWIRWIRFLPCYAFSPHTGALLQQQQMLKPISPVRII